MTKKKPKPSVVAPSPSWTLDDGVSQSLLNRFLGCRERFRLYTIEGMRDKGSKFAMDFGTYFHALLEIHAKYPNLDANGILRHYAAKRNTFARRKSYKPDSLSQEDRDIGNVLLNRYLWWFKDTKYKYIKQEDVFAVPYHVPGYRSIILRGRFDEIIERPDGTIWIQENKTKGKIDEFAISNTLPFNLQTMMYVVAAELKYKRTVSGIVYNVIRTPSHRKGKQDATYADFLERLDGIIAADPKHFFLRIEHPVTSSHMDRWKKYTFNPLLISLIQWWESVKHDPFSPWVARNEKGDPITHVNLDTGEELPLANPHHWMRPFGVFDNLTIGTGDFYEVVCQNRRNNVTLNNKPFQELID